MRMGGRVIRITIVNGLLMIVCAALVWAGPSADAQQTVLMEPPAPLLPAALGKLTRVAEGDSGDGMGQLDAAGLTAQDKAVLTEDGLKRFAKSQYGNSNGKDFWPFLEISVYQFRDVSGAISAFDYFRRDGMRPTNLGDTGAQNGDDVVFRSGPSVVQEHVFNPMREVEANNDLFEHLPKAHGTTGVSPLLPTLLPQKNLDTASVKYALGPAGYAATNGVLPTETVGFEKNGEAVTAKYRGGGTLTLLLYPTPQIAGERARAAENALAGGVKVRREGPLVAIASGAWPAGAAQKMVDGVHLRTDVSFDRPMPLEFHTEIRKTYSLLQAVAAFCGLGALAAIVLGLFFGGGRALVRVLQGKPAYTEPEFIHIDLRGRPHEIRTGADAGPEA
jgi:hypothetical protein